MATPTERLPEPDRRTSLGFLRRSKSTEPLGERKSSGRRKKMDDELRRQRDSYAPKVPPRLPDFSPAPELETFGGEERDKIDSAPVSRPQSGLATSPTMTGSINNVVDPYARTESMTHRGRYSYASTNSTLNSPRRVRRRKDPTSYNVLVIGARNSGKTEFLNFLRSALTMPAHKHPSRTPEEIQELERQTSAWEGFKAQYLETEFDGERVGLTLWDSVGLERNIADLQLRGVTGFLESKFEETLAEEMKVIRSPGARDTHIHCTFLLLDPVRLDENMAAAERAANGTPKAADAPICGILDQNLDLQVLRTVLGKTTVVPVISKADTITSAHMQYLRKAVWNSLKQANIDPLEVLTLEDQEEYTSSESADEDENEETATEANVPGSPSQLSEGTRSQAANQHVPFSILSPDPHSLAAGDQPVGRRFPWGFADPYNADHCDFVRLKDSVFSDWRTELREASRVIWYERWRTNRLNRNGQPAPQKQSTYGGRMGPGDGRRTR
ncbi:unnamed protein product [Penicillium salamii]|uniref:Septin-type G domain-containing protein n=1 Tax=Penicillium salamii TaxID=1612424 RepID=A0A9W4JKY5_9EURO|nr:unnamed protein product [Penicillium salamii]